MFQSHYGAIATSPDESGLPLLCAVSIPLWCDCDSPDPTWAQFSWLVSIPLWCDCDWIFSTHHVLTASGFNPTMVRLRLAPTAPPCPSPCLVSIPLWCDCDYCPQPNFVPAHDVSIPLWCDCDDMEYIGTLLESLGFNPTMVRLRLPHGTSHSYQIHCFNPTMVRLRPGLLSSSNVRLYSFQSHYGAIATSNDRWGNKHCLQFQSHYGAIATFRGAR